MGHPGVDNRLPRTIRCFQLNDSDFLYLCQSQAEYIGKDLKHLCIRGLDCSEFRSSTNRIGSIVSWNIYNSVFSALPIMFPLQLRLSVIPMVINHVQENFPHDSRLSVRCSLPRYNFKTVRIHLHTEKRQAH